MTDTTRKIIAQLQQELEKLPEDAQEECAETYLEDVRRRARSSDPSEAGRRSLRILREAKLRDLPSDYSARLDDYLYGERDE
jgi:hypothetical protein